MFNLSINCQIGKDSTMLTFFNPLETEYSCCCFLSLIQFLILSFTFFLLLLFYLHVFESKLIYVLSRFFSVFLIIFHTLPYDIVNLVPFSVECSGKPDSAMPKHPRVLSVSEITEQRADTFRKKDISDFTRTMESRVSAENRAALSEGKQYAAEAKASAAEATAASAKVSEFEARQSSRERDAADARYMNAGRTGMLSGAAAGTAAMASGSGGKAAAVTAVTTAVLTAAANLLDNAPPKND